MKTGTSTNDDTPPKRTLAPTLINVCLVTGMVPPKRAIHFCTAVESNVRQVLTRHARQGEDAQMAQLQTFLDGLGADLPETFDGRVRIDGFNGGLPFRLTIPIRPVPPV